MRKYDPGLELLLRSLIVWEAHYPSVSGHVIELMEPVEDPLVSPALVAAFVFGRETKFPIC
jgi:hypothetical protein